MLRPELTEEVPPDTARIARAAFPKGAPFMRLRDELGTLFTDTDFTELYPPIGQPALAPWRLALVTVMQYAEHLTDRQAADQVRGRLDWKYALSLELTNPGFDASVLCEFRARLLTASVELKLLDKLLMCSSELGLLKARGKQRSDSTHVLAVIRVMNRLELVTESVRAALNALATRFPEWLREVAASEWYERYAHRAEAARLPRSEAGQREYAELVAQDALTLLDRLKAPSAPPEARELPVIHSLRRVLERHFMLLDGQLHFRTNKELERGAPRLESPYEMDARYSVQRGHEWTGYKVHVTETCDDDLPHLITNIETTTAEVHDAPLGYVIHERLAKRNLLPAQHWLDSGYVSAELLVGAKEQYDVVVIGPPRHADTRTPATSKLFKLRDFEMRWDEQRVICPNGQASVRWTPQRRKGGQAIIVARFDTATCRACALRAACTISKNHPKSLTFQPRAQQEALNEARDWMASREGRLVYQRRMGVEGTVSQGVRVFGLRRARYRGLAKVHLQHVLIAVSLNAVRLVAWFEGKEPERTRVSSFVALRAA